MLKMMVYFTIFAFKFPLPFGTHHDRTALTGVRANRSTGVNRRHLAARLTSLLTAARVVNITNMYGEVGTMSPFPCNKR